MKAVSFLLLFIVASCANKKQITQLDSQKKSTTQANIDFTEFNPELIRGIEIDSFQIDEVYSLDSVFIFPAYCEGDLESYPNPKNWGDRLVLLKNGMIEFQSKPVGDVYLFEPHFYKNQVNSTIIIICQLGFEYLCGGQAFSYKNDEIKYIGDLEIASTNEEFGLAQIVKIHEDGENIYFNFIADSLIFQPGHKDEIIENNIQYIFDGHSLRLKVK